MNAYMRMGVTHREADLMSRLALALSRTGKTWAAFVLIDNQEAGK